MTVERTHIGHETRYALRNGAAVHCILAFDAGPDGRGPAVWKILFPGQNGAEDLYGAQGFVRPDEAQLTTWLTPIAGQDAATQLARAVDADPPPAAAWRRPADG